MNAQFDLIATVDRIGGPDAAGPRQFGQRDRHHPMPPNLYDFRLPLDSPDSPAVFVALQLSDLRPCAQDDWWAGTLRLSLMDGQPVGSWIPFVMYGRPWPIPTFTPLYYPEQFGLFQVGLRAGSPIERL